MKRYALIFLLVLMAFPIGLHARSPKVGFGFEWGISPQFFKFHKFNYISEEGYRVNGDNSGVDYNFNASLEANINFILGKHTVLGLYSGYCGITKDSRVVPLSLRFTLFPKGPDQDCFLYFADAGAGFHLHGSDSPAQGPCFIAKLGAGYRYILGGRTSLDLIVNMQGCIDNPLLKDLDSGGYVKDIRFNSAAYFALSFSAALNF